MTIPKASYRLLEPVLALDEQRQLDKKRRSGDCQSGRNLIIALLPKAPFQSGTNVA
jgi:hypothetical protein